MTVAPDVPVPRPVDALTADGGIVRIRPVTAADAAALAAMYQRAQAESLRMRFFAVPGRRVLEEEVTRLTRPATGRHGALLAEQPGTVLGVASYECLDGPAGSAPSQKAEFAVFVDESQHGRGIGTLLLEHLTAFARDNGVTELIGEVLPGNTSMLRVATDLSGRVWSRFGDGIVDVGVRTSTDEATLAAVDARDRVAGRASLGPLLSPRTVAVVGAGRTPGGIGHETLKSISEHGYTGQLYAVNPHARTVAGVTSLPTLRAVPGPVDLAVIAVPAPAVPRVLTDAAEAGVRVAVVLSAGFEGADEAGRAARAELVRLAREQGIRLVGPNCIGLVNTDPAVRLAATFTPTVPASGGLAVASQSGAVGIAVLDHAARHGCGISSFVSMGDKVDVSGNDLLTYWFDDPATTAVALYLESFGNPRKFARVVRALARRKPVIAAFSGRSAAGQRAGATHTAIAPAVPIGGPADATHTAGAMSAWATVDALFAQAGVVRVNHLGELLDAARMLTNQPLPAGDRLAVLGNTGGVNVLAADAAEAAGLRVPEFSPLLRARLARALPEAAGVDNPVDLGATAAPAAFASATELILASGEADAVLVMAASTRTNDIPGALRLLAPLVDRWDRIPVASVLLGCAGAPTSLGTRRTPVFDLPEQAVAALGHAARYARWLREPLGAHPELSDIDPAAARAAVNAGLAAGGGWQPHPRTTEILSAYGIPLIGSLPAVDERSAVAAAARLGYPVAVKSGDPQLVHKSDVGAVRLGLTDADQVRAGYRAVAAAAGPQVLVQPMASGQVELIAGVVHDRLFGSLVLLGLGGVHTDLLDDRTLRLVPLTDLDAGRMWRSLRSAPLLSGYRGTAPVDTAAVEDLLLRLGALAVDLPEVAELDLNPVFAGARGVVAVDAKLRLAPVGEEPDASLRRLR